MSISELLLTVFVAVIVFGPDKLPMLAKHIGLAVKKLNRLKEQFSEFWQQQLNEAQLLENTQKAEKVDGDYQSGNKAPD